MPLYNPTSAGGVQSGTSFPVSPATNDLFHRTDRGIIYYYDGTRWLSTQRLPLAIAMQSALMPITTTPLFLEVPLPPNDNGIYVCTFAINSYANNTTAANYYTAQLFSAQGASVTNLGSAISTQNNAQTQNIRQTTAINSVVASSQSILGVQLTGTGTASSVMSMAIDYRLIG